MMGSFREVMYLRKCQSLVVGAIKSDLKVEVSVLLEGTMKAHGENKKNMCLPRAFIYHYATGY